MGLTSEMDGLLTVEACAHVIMVVLPGDCAVVW